VFASQGRDQDVETGKVCERRELGSDFECQQIDRSARVLIGQEVRARGAKTFPE